ncbi:MAG: caspase family protein [Telluria sp.]
MHAITHLLLTCGVALCAAGASASANDSLRKVALVVGNGSYSHALALPNPPNDASDVCNALRKLDFEVICKLNLATKREFKDAIYEFSGKLNENSVAFFYFAGHGLQIDGLNYLIPTNAALRTKSDIEDESVQINYLMNELETRRAAVNIFVLDACRNNPFINPVRGYAPTMGMATQLYAPRNSIVAMSTGPGQLSLDGVGRNGTFNKNLLKHLVRPGLGVEEMLKAVSGGTRTEALKEGLRQDPQITSSYADKYCVAGCGDTRLAGANGQLSAAELAKLQRSLAQTRATQLELEQQKTALTNKQAELDAMRARLERAPGSDTAALDSTLNASAAKLQELENMKHALLKKQQELDALRQSLSARSAAAPDERAVQTRKVDAPDDKAKQMSIVPSF